MTSIEKDTKVVFLLQRLESAIPNVETFHLWDMEIFQKYFGVSLMVTTLLQRGIISVHKFKCQYNIILLVFFGNRNLFSFDLSIYP